jgi:hypothetical protein
MTSQSRCYLHNLGIFSGSCSTNRSSNAYGPLACDNHSRHAELLTARAHLLHYTSYETDGKCIALSSTTGTQRSIKRCSENSHPKSWFCLTHHNMGERKREQAVHLCYFLAHNTTPMDVDEPDELINNNYTTAYSNQSNQSNQFNQFNQFNPPTPSNLSNPTDRSAPFNFGVLKIPKSRTTSRGYGLKREQFVF